MGIVTDLEGKAYILRTLPKPATTRLTSTILSFYQVHTNIMDKDYQTFMEMLIRDQLDWIESRMKTRKSRKTDKLQLGEYKITLHYTNNERYETQTISNILRREKYITLPGEIQHD